MLVGAICDLSLYILAEDANYLENSSSPNFFGTNSVGKPEYNN